MSEFTGKQKNVYRVKCSVTVQRMIEHVTEGYVPLPGDKEQEIVSATVREFDDDTSAALDLYEALKAV